MRSRFTARVTSSRITTSPTGTTASTSQLMAIRTARRTRFRIAYPLPSISTTTIFPTWRTTASKPTAAPAIFGCSRIAASTRPGAHSDAQPMFGGPLYFYRNLVYDATTGGPLKLIDTPAGVLVYQNTFVGQGRLMGPASNVHFLNNLILGDGFADPVLNLRTYTNYSTSDYNGFRPNPNVEDAFEWNSPAFEVAGDYQGPGVTRHFKSLEEYSRATHQE